MKKINKLLFIFLLFSFQLVASNEDLLSKRNFSINDLSKALLSETGLNNDDENIWKNVFIKQSYDDLKTFFSNLPINNPSPIVQELIYKILISKKDLNKRSISQREDEELFEIIMDKLFQSGRLNEIELFYSQSAVLQENEMILSKMIEGNFLRNRHSEACKILENKVKEKPIKFGKIMVICDILNSRYEQARFGLALLKEQNNPGDIFFIELAFSLMSEDKLSESDYLIKTLNEIKQLNPVVMTSLQFADISPNFEQIENLTTSGLLFILSNPTVETDLKIHCAEILVKQGRINYEMLSEAYQLPRFDNKDIENSIKLYKTLSPIKSRPLLYQSILRDENPDSQFQKIKALLKVSVNENLFTKISFLVEGLLDYEDYIISEDEAILFSKMYQATKKFYEARNVLDKINNIEKKVINEISIDLKQVLNNQNIDERKLEENIKKVDSIEQSDVLKKIILIMSISSKLNSEQRKILISFKNTFDDKANKTDLKNLFLAETFSSEKDFFNSIKIFFNIVGNKEISDLNLLETYSAFLILKNLGLTDELNLLSENILL